MSEALIGFTILLALCFLTVPLGFAALLVGFAGFAILRGASPALVMSSQQVMETATNYGLSVIPLFILMGVFIYRSNIANELYDAAYLWLGRFRGGLAMSTVLACAGFSAICGSTLATAATMSKVAMPSMRRYRYDDSLSTGTIAAGGTLGIMIPPSVPLVIYGIIAEQDIGQLFMAGILPGLLLVLLFIMAVMIVVRLRPQAGPAGEKLPPEQQRKAVRGVWPVLVLFVAVLGGMYTGVFTPTEGAGIGAFGAALIAFLRGSLSSVNAWLECLVDAGRTTAALFTVIFGTQVFGEFINLTGFPYDLLDWVDGLELSAFGLVVMIRVICVVMGMVFETMGILLLIVPVFMPALIGFEVNLIWFGIL
ncbi:MAG: TRAP transporter large permease subunit, partial [Thiothrix sp.]|nr:TRAP transporter large permease subunit [Thiothrix sp.]